ncbi:MAG: flagellar type III secretion system pore protein FliP [Candidatus Eremiobacteraeota bacterium]|nr:flagellar type III secretion system pore protein FliP [Candidatus Eremiobacteraeota bacterium]MBV8370889.1 flagellar type III secretion system pore protein FliP [Candidatus Eremiobacteraeota bacterium]
MGALAGGLALVLFAVPALAQGVPGPSSPTLPIPRVNIGVTPSTKPSDVALSLQILLLLTVVTLAPTLLVLLTSFTRIVVVLSFVRTALGTQQVPPTQVLVGLSLLLTFFVMNPVIQDINKNALQPYLGNKISQKVAIDRAAKPLRAFMFKQTREKDIALFYSLTKEPRPANQDDVPTYLLVPAFVISELKTAFQIGFAIYIPFIVIDMVVASVLLSMGMMMIPPVIISLPFKILIFLLVDGWNLTVAALFASFNR